MKHLKFYLYISLAINGLYLLILIARAIVAYSVAGDIISHRFLYELLGTDILFISAFHVLDPFMILYAPFFLLPLLLYGLVLLIKTKPRPRILRATMIINFTLFLFMAVYAVLFFSVAGPIEGGPEGVPPEAARLVE